MARHSKEFPTSGPALWLVRLFILPHTCVGVFLIGQFLLTLIWLICVDDMNGKVTRAWTEQHKGTNYYIGYRYKIGPTEHSDQTTISASAYDQLPESIRQPKPLPESQTLDAVSIRLRAFTFGRMEKVSPLPPLGHYPIVEFGQTLFFTLFWNGIVSVFLYQAWVRPYRLRRSASFMLKPPARPTHRTA